MLQQNRRPFSAPMRELKGKETQLHFFKSTIKPSIFDLAEQLPIPPPPSPQAMRPLMEAGRSKIGKV